MATRGNYIGQRTGKLTIIADGPDQIGSTGTKRRTFIARCDCGDVTLYTYQQIRSDRVLTCGNCETWLQYTERREREIEMAGRAAFEARRSVRS